MVRVVRAERPDYGEMHYLIDEQTLDFIPEAKEFLDLKAARIRAPGTIKAYCHRLRWLYLFLEQRSVKVFDVKPEHLVDFVVWLCNPYRTSGKVVAAHTASPFTARHVNLILAVVSSFFGFLVRRGLIAETPVSYVETPRGRWLSERDLLAHTRTKATHRVNELKLREPEKRVKTISATAFDRFVNAIHLVRSPAHDPSGFRDRLIAVFLHESGLRVGELCGLRMDDLDFGESGVHVRFRPNNENKARAKAGYGRDRFVHLPKKIMGMLDIYISEVWVDASPSTDHVFIVLNKNAQDAEGKSTYGKALSTRAVQEQFEYYSAKIGVRCHPHMLRHTHATNLVRSFIKDGREVDWKFVQERLGHSSVVTTMEMYTHLTDEDRRAAYQQYVERRDNFERTSQISNAGTTEPAESASPSE